ncbi:MAG: hypothetical protein K8I29_08740 [Alphaproteobacteria bacterium]|uniref:DUF5659 domain-containing protein n=1 Tax=Candidatus Nitrobium versatile TaxID=2884831 RepID=A0A953J5Y2_9BACT|nr:hypothetical protein [Candidatus Nitrobium versatile]
MELEKSTLEDTAVVAYLALRGHRFKPVKKYDGRIAFEVEGDIAHSLQEIYDNKPCPILDYIKSLKTVRGAIFSLKQAGGRQ